MTFDLGRDSVEVVGGGVGVGFLYISWGACEWCKNLHQIIP